MQRRVPEGVEDAQEYEAGGADEGEGDGEHDEHLLGAAPVGDEAAAVAEPALGEEGDVEGQGDDAGAGDEERLELVGADVADVGERHARLHVGEEALLLVHHPPEEHAEQHPQPDDAGEDWEPLGGLNFTL